MSRRAVHVKIINNYSTAAQKRAFDRLMARMSDRAFTDEALELWVQILGRQRRFNNRINAENRAIARRKAVEK